MFCTHVVVHRHIGAQFFNEVKKRELGRQAADRNGCTHFMTMDTDEFYLSEQFVAAKKYIEKNSLPATACRMRIIFKEPIYELLPYDNMNAVPFIFEVKKTCPFRLCAKRYTKREREREKKKCGKPGA